MVDIKDRLAAIQLFREEKQMVLEPINVKLYVIQIIKNTEST